MLVRVVQLGQMHAVISLLLEWVSLKGNLTAKDTCVHAHLDTRTPFSDSLYSIFSDMH